MHGRRGRKGRQISSDFYKFGWRLSWLFARSPSQLIEDIEDYVLGRLSTEEYTEVLDQYPALHDLHPIVVEQGVGDAIFVPSGSEP